VARKWWRGEGGTGVSWGRSDEGDAFWLSYLLLVIDTENKINGFVAVGL
jgi:hypothetical protein